MHFSSRHFVFLASSYWQSGIWFTSSPHTFCSLGDGPFFLVGHLCGQDVSRREESGWRGCYCERLIITCGKCWGKWWGGGGEAPRRQHSREAIAMDRFLILESKSGREEGWVTTCPDFLRTHWVSRNSDLQTTLNKKEVGKVKTLVLKSENGWHLPWPKDLNLPSFVFWRTLPTCLQSVLLI